MIKVKIELWPHGSEENKQELASANIWNDGTGNQQHGSYGYELFGKSGHRVASGKVKEFKRKEYTVWWLVAAIMKVVYYHKVDKAFRDNQIYFEEL